MNSKTRWLAVWGMSAFLLLTVGCAGQTSRCRVLADGTFSGRCAELIARSKHHGSRFSTANVTIADGVKTQRSADLIRGAAPATPSPPASNTGPVSLSPERCNGVDDDGDGLVDEWDADNTPRAVCRFRKGSSIAVVTQKRTIAAAPMRPGGATFLFRHF